jgi:tetratricopeptide (TPR) repeat protein
MPSRTPGIDYYELLQVHPKASLAVIKKAYRTLMLEAGNHPDQGGSAEVSSRMSEAYAVLSNPERRAAYDAVYFLLSEHKRHQGPSQPQAAKPSKPEAPKGNEAPSAHEPPSESLIVLCPRCQIKNRVKSQDWLSLAHCSRCGQALKQLPHPVTSAFDALRYGSKGWHRPARSQALRVAVSLVLFIASGAALWSAFSRPVEDALETTEHLRKEGKLAQAAHLLQKALHSEPSNPRLHEKLGDIYFKQLLYDPALNEYKLAIALNPENSYLYTLEGQTLMALKRNQEAEISYQEALRLDPDQSSALVALGNLYAKQQEFSLAENLYRQALHNQPDADIFYNLGMVYQWDNQYEPARRAFTSALIQDPNHRSSMVSLAALYYAHGQYNQAAAQLVKANQLKHGDLDLHLRLADIYERTGQLKAAIQEWQVCVEQSAASPAVLAHAKKELQRLSGNSGAG